MATAQPIRKSSTVCKFSQNKEMLSGVKAIFSGHYHRNAGGKFNNLDMVVTSAIGCQLGEDKHGVRVVVVTEDKIHHKYISLDELSDLTVKEVISDHLEQDRPSIGGGTVVYSQEGVALGSGPHELTTDAPVYDRISKSNYCTDLVELFTLKISSIVFKVMEGVINRTIKQHLFSDAQFGYSQGHSAADLITALIQTWTKELNSRGE
eukprot:g40817.t1